MNSEAEDHPRTACGPDRSALSSPGHVGRRCPARPLQSWLPGPPTGTCPRGWGWGSASQACRGHLPVFSFRRIQCFSVLHITTHTPIRGPVCTCGSPFQGALAQTCTLEGIFNAMSFGRTAVTHGCAEYCPRQLPTRPFPSRRSSGPRPVWGASSGASSLPRGPRTPSLLLVACGPSSTSYLCAYRALPFKT